MDGETMHDVTGDGAVRAVVRETAAEVRRAAAAARADAERAVATARALCARSPAPPEPASAECPDGAASPPRPGPRGGARRG